MVREGVPTQTKEQWIMNEVLIDKKDNYIEIQPEKRNKETTKRKEKEKKDTQIYDISKCCNLLNKEKEN